MGIKRIVDTSFWTDGKVDEFSPEDKYFMLYLLTNPFSTQLGIYEVSIKQVAFQLGYSVDAVKALIERFENYGIILFSPKTKEIAIKNFLQHSIVKGGAPVRDCLIKEMRAVKNKALIAEVFSHLEKKPTYEETVNLTVKNIIADFWESGAELRYCNERHGDDTSTIRQRYVNESYNNENENDNENDNDNDNDKEDSNSTSLTDVPRPPKEKISCQSIVELYHSICVSFPSVRSLSEARKKAIKARLNTYSLEQFEMMFKKAEASDFLKGRNDRNWSANFDWLIKDANMAKVLDGNYDNRRKHTGRNEMVPEWMDAEEVRVRHERQKRFLAELKDDLPLQERAEQLKERLKG